MKQKTAIIRVRYQETDKMGVAYHANYLVWFEVAQTEYMRRAGLTYRAWEEDGYRLPVVEAGCRYSRPALYDDEVELYAALSLQGASFRFDYEARRMADGALLAVGWTEHVCLNAAGKLDRAATRKLAACLALS